MILLSSTPVGFLSSGDRVYHADHGEGTLTKIIVNEHFNVKDHRRRTIRVIWDNGSQYEDYLSRARMFRIGNSKSVRDPKFRIVKNVPWSELKVGDTLSSTIGTSGEIVDLEISNKYPDKNDPDNYIVHVKWASGVQNRIEHDRLDCVLLVDQQRSEAVS